MFDVTRREAVEALIAFDTDPHASMAQVSNDVFSFLMCRGFLSARDLRLTGEGRAYLYSHAERPINTGNL